MVYEFRPFKIPPHDGSDDITDVWLEERDPENESGQTCDAFYVDTEERSGWRCKLVGMRITGGMGDKLWSAELPRDIALLSLGPDTVARLERLRESRLYGCD